MLRALLGSAALLLTLTAGCIHLPSARPLHVPAPPGGPAAKDYGRALPEGAHALRRLDDPLALPAFAPALADRAGLAAAVERSLAYLAKPSSRRFFPASGIEHEQVVRSLQLFAELLAAGLGDDELAAEVRSRFDVYTSVGCDDRGTVLFTGYYTPIFEASLVPEGPFRHPLHRLPSNHVKDPITGQTLGLRREDGAVDPDYPGRDLLLASGLLEGRELAYLSSAFEAYVAGVQGSAFLRLRDGSLLEVGYAGTNGKPYRSIGKALIDAGRLRPEELNLRDLIEFFRQRPGEFDRFAATNERYVFFQESAGGPFGSLGEAVTAGRSIATDKTIFPRGALCLYELGEERRLVLDQDTGGAIRAPGRCDLYQGVGDEAGEVAGRILAEGRLYYLIAKDELLLSLR